MYYLEWVDGSVCNTLPIIRYYIDANKFGLDPSPRADRVGRIAKWSKASCWP